MEQPLVSLGLITYNSSKYVVEALDSMKAQTYPNLELIISDDCSTDNTVDICRDWLEKNGDRFVRTEILVPPHNTGTSANCNRLMCACRGEWVKSLAGDDMLTPNCIEDFMEFVKIHPVADVVFGDFSPLLESPVDKDSTIKSFLRTAFSELTYSEFQLNIYCRNFLPAPASFINKKCWLELGGYEEKIPLIEDWPFWVKAFNSKRKILFLNKVVCIYRINNTSVSHSNNTRYSSNYKSALQFAHNMLKMKNIFYWYFVTMTLEMGNNPLKKYLFHPIDLFNPYRRRVLSALDKLNTIIEQYK